MLNLFLKLKNYLAVIWQGIKFLPKLNQRQVLQIFLKLTKKDRWILAVLGIIFLISGSFLITHRQTRVGPPYGGELIEGLLGQPQYINPILAAASSVDSDLSRIVFAQLFKFDQNLKLTSDLAESLPVVSTDQKTYTIKLKPNLKWQDGQALSADDVIFTIQTIQNADYGSPLRANFIRVKTDKVDDLTVSLKLRGPNAGFVTNLMLGLIPKHVWQGSNAGKFRLSDRNLKPIGSGPFLVSEIKATSDGTIKSLVLKPNEFYSTGRPYLNSLTFKFYDNYDSLLAAYQAREITSLGFIPFDKKAFLSQSDSINQYQISLPQYQAVFFNLPKNAVLTDKAVRQALWLATDRQAIIDNVYFGLAKPSFGPILEGNLGYNPQVAAITHYNLAEAEDILNRARWNSSVPGNVRSKTQAKGKNKATQNLEFSLATNNFALNIKTAQILQEQWAKLGARVNLVIVSAQELEQQYIRPRKFDALLFSENTGADPDPFAFWHSSQTRDPGLNLSGFANIEVDRLLTAARQTNDVAVRTKAYQQFQLIMTQELPAIFLDNAVYVYNVPKKIHGINLTTIISPAERFLDIAHWYSE